MKERRKAGRGSFVVSVLGVLLCVMMLWGGTCLAAEDARQDKKQVFDIGAQLLSSEGSTYDIQLTLCNQGEDWEGTVRVQMDVSYDALSCAYDTAIALPQGSTKQFVVRIPVRSIEDQDAAVKVSLLDQKGRAAEKSFKRLLLDGADVLFMGILSDSYPLLTYLDMGGESVYYGGIEYPVQLMELDQDNLSDALSYLNYLVIDDYNTSILPDTALDRIRQWVDDGGMLIVGTGEHAEDTLGGLEFLDIECIRVNGPGEGAYTAAYGTGLEQLSLAELKDATGRYYTEPESLIMVSSWGDGAVEVVPYALSELGQPDLAVAGWESCVWQLLQNANGYVSILNNYRSQYETDYIIRGIFRSFGNGSSNLNFGVLKWIVVLYVIFVGPVLYLILRAVRKRDWYWGAVPVTVLVGILLVYFAGRGFEVVNTRVYSVTVEKLSGQEAGDTPGSSNVTYLHCYDAGYREWGLRLAERFGYAGPVFGNYFYGNTDDKYRYHINREGDRVSLGMDPERGFEDAYFLTETSQKMETGSISCDLEASAKWGITGTVRNETSRDFLYFAVVADNVLYVYENLPAGETRTLEEAVYTSRQQSYDTVVEAYRHDYMSSYDRDHRGRRRDYDTIAALGTGIWEVFSREQPGGTVIIGVTKDWEKAVDDDCSETAYGCLYAVQ